MTMQHIDGIAFTRGPGEPGLMESRALTAQTEKKGIGGCLSVGSNAAKTLAAALGKPLVGVHHMVRFH